ILQKLHLLVRSFQSYKMDCKKKRLINKGMTSSNLPFLNSVGPPTLSSPANPSSFPQKSPKIRGGGK
ncbi:unnamed protein product, partial [Sphagnum jensenii]